MNEDEIINIMKKIGDFPKESVLNFYDDAWSCKIGPKYLVVTTDMLVASTDVPERMKFEHVGRKAITSVVSDLSSKGVRPKYYLVSLGLPNTLSTENLRDLAKGLSTATEEYGGTIVAGDTNESKDININVAAIGLNTKKPIPRRIGETGDIVAVTGPFGEAAAGLKMILEGFSLRTGEKRLLRSFLEPRARLPEGVALSEADVLRGATDSSDGLVLSLYNLLQNCNPDKRGIRLDFLPFSEELRRFCLDRSCDLQEFVLYGGEEYELVVIVRKNSWPEAQKSVSKVRGRLIRIGEVIQRPGVWMSVNDKLIRVRRRGWRHFARAY
jgi:thiamine-monophosphate kinase